MDFKSIEFKNEELYLLDQRFLPVTYVTFICKTFEDVEFAIRDMVVRGAPAIGAAGAYGVVLAAKEYIKLFEV
jgi:methylthioribose-1-phosphate isomerase